MPYLACRLFHGSRVSVEAGQHSSRTRCYLAPVVAGLQQGRQRATNLTCPLDISCAIHKNVQRVELLVSRFMDLAFCVLICILQRSILRWRRILRHRDTIHTSTLAAFNCVIQCLHRAHNPP